MSFKAWLLAGLLHLVLAARFPEPPAAEFFTGLAAGETAALEHLTAYAAALGMDAGEPPDPPGGCDPSAAAAVSPPGILCLVSPENPTARSRELRELLLRHRPAVLAAAARHGASNVRIFGSVARGDARPESDIDLLIDVEPSRSLLELAGLLVELQDILGVRVDLVEASALRPEDDDILTDAVAV